MIDKGMLYRKGFQGGGADMGGVADSKGNVGSSFGGGDGGNNNSNRGRDLDYQQRGRLLAIKIENDAVGETWRYGTLRVDVQPDGRR